MAQGGDIDQIRVLGMDSDLSDVTSLLESQVRPGLSSVGGAVHSVAVGDVGADGGFSRSGVDHVGIGRGDGQGADGRGVEEAVGDVLPIGAAVFRLPDTARHGAEVEDHGVGGMTGHRHHPSPAKRSRQTPPEARKRLLGPRISCHEVLLVGDISPWSESLGGAEPAANPVVARSAFQRASAPAGCHGDS